MLKPGKLKVVTAAFMAVGAAVLTANIFLALPFALYEIWKVKKKHTGSRSLFAKKRK